MENLILRGKSQKKKDLPSYLLEAALNDLTANKLK